MRIELQAKFIHLEVNRNTTQLCLSTCDILCSFNENIII